MYGREAERERERREVGQKWQSTIYYGSFFSPGKSPEANASVKYSEKDQEKKHWLLVT